MIEQPGGSMLSARLLFRIPYSVFCIPPGPKRARTSRAFTLVELLVALAIFAMLIGAFAVLFTTSLRTRMAGEQSMDAFERARGAINALEKDIITAFQGRDAGYTSVFYGTPIGCMFVGLIADPQGGKPQMGRVTYVIYQPRPLPDTTPAQQNCNDEENRFRRQVAYFEARDGEIVFTYRLLRYFEPGITDLDSYPNDWRDAVRGLVNAVKNTTAVPGVPVCASWDTACIEQMRKATVRELWIRCLAGDPDPGLPDLWAMLDKNPMDYIVAENIATMPIGDNDPDPYWNTFEELVCGWQPFLPFGREPGADELPSSFFLYGDAGRHLLGYWNDGVNATRVVDSFETHGAGQVLAERDFGVAGANWTVKAKIGCTLVVDNGTGGFWTSEVLDSEADTLSLRNSWPSNTRSTLNRWWLVSDLGAPLQPAVPELVKTQFKVVDESRYPGAPDFDKNFTQVIHAPSAYKREKAEK